MYDLRDTIVAISSPSGGVRSIVRLTGPQTLTVCEQVFQPASDSPIRDPQSEIRNPVVLGGQVRVNDLLTVAAHLYLFFAPRSYTGEDLAELHVAASPVLVEALVQGLLAQGLRPAEPGEFTARAYLNGKLDLAQAEAVNEVISSSNRLQLEAAEKLLSGRLTKAADEIHTALLDVLSRIEAGLDFSGEDIEFIGTSEAAAQLAAIRKSLEELLAGSIRCETLVDLPAVGIAGAPNAGKSSLLNALLGWERSIVSPQARTTRDVLSGVLTTDRFQCVLFDCAGLVLHPDNPLDELAQQAAVAALQRCSAVVFCVDAAKVDLNEDLAIRTLIRPENTVYVATKSDLLPPERFQQRSQELKRSFNADFLPVSAKAACGLQELLDSIEKVVVHGDPARGPSSLDAVPRPLLKSAIRNIVTPDFDPGPQSEISALALTARHRQAVTEATQSVHQALAEVRHGNEEVAVLMIRAACQALAQIEQQPLDEQVLDRIFSRFCIGK